MLVRSGELYSIESASRGTPLASKTKMRRLQLLAVALLALSCRSSPTEPDNTGTLIVTITFSCPTVKQIDVYVDGAVVAQLTIPGQVILRLPAGAHVLRLDGGDD